MRERLSLVHGRFAISSSPGNGTTPSLSIEMLKQGLGVTFVAVPPVTAQLTVTVWLDVVDSDTGRSLAPSVSLP